MKNLLIFLVAISLYACGSAAVATDLTIDGIASAVESDSFVDYMVLVIANKIMEHPVLALVLTALSAAMPLLGLIANQTKNPIDNAALIFLNKLVQTLTFATSKNQPDVLSWRQMISNRPSSWPMLIAEKVAQDQMTLNKRVFM